MNILFKLEYNETQFRIVQISNAEVRVDRFWPEENIFVPATDTEAKEVSDLALISMATRMTTAKLALEV